MSLIRREIDRIRRKRLPVDRLLDAERRRGVQPVRQPLYESVRDVLDDEDRDTEIARKFAEDLLQRGRSPSRRCDRQNRRAERAAKLCGACHRWRQQGLSLYHQPRYRDR